jgi:hypothetical protein
MEACSRAGIMNLSGLAIIHPKSLCSLIFRVLPKLFGGTPSSPKTFQQDEHVNSPPMGTALRTTPELPRDILMAIFAALEIPDLMRAASVCTSWRSAYSELRSLAKYKLSQTPCLFYTSESAGENVAFLYSLVEKRAYKLDLPEPPIRSRFLIGSSHGWLVTVDDRSEMHLLNPITSEQVALPSMITMEHLKPIFSKSGAVDKYELSRHTATNVWRRPSIYALSELRNHFHYKAFVFPETRKGSYIVVLIHEPDHQLSFARVGDDKWTWLPPHTEYEDCSYKDGLLYATTAVREIHVFDLSASVISVKVIMEMVQYVKCENMYIAQAPWGDLLNVWRYAQYYQDSDPETMTKQVVEIKLYRVDTMSKKIVETKCLHDHVLFLGHNQSLCLSAKEYPTLKANHAYFTDNYELYLKGFRNNRRDIGVFDLQNNRSEDLVSPQLWSNWPCPVWITPSLAKMDLKLKKQL